MIWRRLQSGFSLMEVALSIGIVGFSFVALLGAFPVGLKQNAASVTESRATQLANHVFASLSSPQPDGSVILCTDSSPQAPALNISSKQPQDFWIYAAYPAAGQPPMITPALNDKAAASTYYLHLSIAPLDSDPAGELGARIARLTIYSTDPRRIKNAGAATSLGGVQFCSIVNTF